jgi:hypothetical protein
MSWTNLKVFTAALVISSAAGFLSGAANARSIDALEARCFDASLRPHAIQLACMRLQTLLLKKLLEKKLDVTVQAPAVSVAAPQVNVPPPQVTVNVPDRQNALFIRRDFANCNKPNLSTCERVAQRLCKTVGYQLSYIVYDERDYARANGLLCYDEPQKK